MIDREKFQLRAQTPVSKSKEDACESTMGLIPSPCNCVHVFRNMIFYQNWLNRCTRDEGSRLEMHQSFPVGAGTLGPEDKLGPRKRRKDPLLDHVDSFTSAICTLPAHKDGLVELNACAHERDGLIFHPIHHVGESRSEDQDGVKERTVWCRNKYRGFIFCALMACYFDPVEARAKKTKSPKPIHHCA